MAATTRHPDDRLVTFKLKGWSRPNMPYNEFKVKPVGGEGNMTLVNRAGDRNSLGLNQAWLRQPPENATKDEIDEYPFWGHQIHNDIKKFNEANTSKRRVLCYDIRHGEADHNRWKKLLLTEWDGPCEYRKWPIFQYPEGSGNFYCLIDPPLTGKGRQDATEANELFKKLKRHRFPMPEQVYMSPLLRAVETFELALERNLGIKLENCYVVWELREQETGNCADVQLEEFVKSQKTPPSPGSYTCKDWMEPSTRNEKGKLTNKKLETRVKRLFKEIPNWHGSDCIARVTHSLLNRHTLKSDEFEVGEGTEEAKVMEKFMLDEGGSFAYVIEYQVKKTQEATSVHAKPKLKWRKYEDYKNIMGKRRLTAFPGIGGDLNKIIKTGFEPKVFETAYASYGKNIERKKLMDNSQKGENKMRDGNGKAIGSRNDVASKGNVDGSNIVKNSIISDGRTNVDRNKTAMCRGTRDVALKKNTDTTKNMKARSDVASKRITGATNNARVDNGVNVDGGRSTGTNKTVRDSRKVNRQKKSPQGTC